MRRHLAAQDAALVRRTARRFCGLALVVTALWLSAAARTALGQEGDDASGEPIRIARLVRQLGSRSFLEREQADAQLHELGPAGRKWIERAADSEDPEVRQRARQLLRKWNIARLWAPSPVALSSPSLPAGEAISTICRQSGNQLVVGDPYKGFEDKPVKLDAEPGIYWQFVDQICRQSGNYVRPHYSHREGNLVVVAGECGKYPTAYAGPLRAQITSARRVFTEDYDYEDASSDVSHTFQINVQVLWEDRFRLAAYQAQPEVIECTTCGGRQLSSAQVVDRSWSAATSSTRQLVTSLRLEPPSPQEDKLDRLVLRWRLAALGEMATLVVDDPQPMQTVRQDDLEVIIEDLTAGSDNRWTLQLSIWRNLEVPKPAEVLLHENEVELLDATGQPLRLENQINSQGDAQARLKLTFVADDGETRPRTLRLHYPQYRTGRDLDIVFRDVPLPQAQPK